jgi:Tfp pilus assembly ATPase PilU
MDTIGEYDMTDLLTLVVTERAEGLSVTPGQPLAVHFRGEVYVIEGPAVSPEHALSLLRSVADTRQMRELHERGGAEFLFTFRDSARFRVTARREHDEVQFQIHATA